VPAPGVRNRRENRHSGGVQDLHSPDRTRKCRRGRLRVDRLFRRWCAPRRARSSGGVADSWSAAVAALARGPRSARQSCEVGQVNGAASSFSAFWSLLPAAIGAGARADEPAARPPALAGEIAWAARDLAGRVSAACARGTGGEAARLGARARRGPRLPLCGRRKSNCFPITIERRAANRGQRWPRAPGADGKGRRSHACREGPARSRREVHRCRRGAVEHAGQLHDREAGRPRALAVGGRAGGRDGAQQLRLAVVRRRSRRALGSPSPSDFTSPAPVRSSGSSARTGGDAPARGASSSRYI
jgi:hypothetical protein